VPGNLQLAAPAFDISNLKGLLTARAALPALATFKLHFATRYEEAI
jgi:hypothetical protein